MVVWFCGGKEKTGKENLADRSTDNTQQGTYIYIRLETPAKSRTLVRGHLYEPARLSTAGWQKPGGLQLSHAGPHMSICDITSRFGPSWRRVHVKMCARECCARAHRESPCRTPNGVKRDSPALETQLCAQNTNCKEAFCAHNAICETPICIRAQRVLRCGQRRYCAEDTAARGFLRWCECAPAHQWGGPFFFWLQMCVRAQKVPRHSRMCCHPTMAQRARESAPTHTELPAPACM